MQKGHALYLMVPTHHFYTLHLQLPHSTHALCKWLLAHHSTLPPTSLPCNPTPASPLAYKLLLSHCTNAVSKCVADPPTQALLYPTHPCESVQGTCPHPLRHLLMLSTCTNAVSKYVANTPFQALLNPTHPCESLPCNPTPASPLDAVPQRPHPIQLLADPPAHGVMPGTLPLVGQQQLGRPHPGRRGGCCTCCCGVCCRCAAAAAAPPPARHVNRHRINSRVGQCLNAGVRKTLWKVSPARSLRICPHMCFSVDC